MNLLTSQLMWFLLFVAVFVVITYMFYNRTEGFSCLHCKKKGQTCTWSWECPTWSWGCYGKKCY